MRSGNHFKILYFLLSFALILPMAVPDAVQAGEVSGSPNDRAPLNVARMIAADDSRIILELEFAEPQVLQRVVAGQSCQEIRADGLDEMDQPGWPRLPGKGAMLGIPLVSNPVISLVDAESEVLPGSFNLCPRIAPIMDLTLGQGIDLPAAPSNNSVPPLAHSGYFPASLAEVMSTGFIRSQRVAQIRIYPYQFNPQSGAVRFNRRLRIVISFNPAADPNLTRMSAVDENAFEAVLKNTILNYDQARNWRSRPAAGAGNQVASSAATAAAAAAAYKIMVNRDGIYQLDYAGLQAAGVPVDAVDPRTFRILEQNSTELALFVSGEADGGFDPGDQILFYGLKVNTRYTDTNVYWLTWGEQDGLRMDESDGTPGGTSNIPATFPTTQHLEEDHQYYASYPSGPDLDRWYWGYILASGTPASKTYPIELDNVSGDVHTATVRGLFKGYLASPRHHTRISINDNVIDDATWLPNAEYAFEVNFSQSFLVDGINNLKVEYILDGGITLEALFVNWFEIDYAQTYNAHNDRLSFNGVASGPIKYVIGGFTTNAVDTFDITNPAAPVRILNGSFQPAGDSYTLTFEQNFSQQREYISLAPAKRLAPAAIVQASVPSLKNASNGADYIVISHPNFLDAIQPLAAFRAAKGLRTRVVNVQDIYDEFAGGVFNPEAIQSFLAYAYADWQAPAPTYVLLVGDGHYDFKNNMVRGEVNYMPPYLADVDYWMKETAADNRYVCVSGSDALPDMAIGRLPVKTTAELDALVAKIIQSEQQPLPVPGDWNENVLFVADKADEDGDYAFMAEDLINQYLPSAYKAHRIYYGLTHVTAGEANEAILEGINSGHLIVHYNGHGAPTLWSNGPIFTKDDLQWISNEGRLPFVLSMTCMEGYFIHPSDVSKEQEYSSLAESLLRLPGNGTIANFSSTGLGLSSANDILGQGVLDAIFNHHVIEIGLAATMGKLYLNAQTGGSQDLIDTYTLFGDPATTLNIIPLKVFLPGVSR